MQLYTGMLKLDLFQVTFLNLDLGKGGSKSACCVSFDRNLLETFNSAQSKWNLVTVELYQNKFASATNFSMTSSRIVQVVKTENQAILENDKEMTRTGS